MAIQTKKTILILVGITYSNLKILKYLAIISILNKLRSNGFDSWWS